jgi:putative membrane protein
MMWYPHLMGGFGPAFMLLPVFILVALVAGVVLLATRNAGGGQQAGVSGGSTPDNAIRILADRYARGEIDEDEYRRRLQTLGVSWSTVSLDQQEEPA